MKRKKEEYNIILSEDVYAVDSLGMNFMTKGTKGVLVLKGDSTSAVQIGSERYTLSNASFLEITEEPSERSAA